MLLRDYGMYDMTQMRFINKRGRKLAENFYMRADGTRTYFFSKGNIYFLNGFIFYIITKKKYGIQRA